MLVAECPRRAQLLCEKFFEADKPGTTFEYRDDVDERLILPLMATVPSILDHLQPRKLCRPSHGGCLTRVHPQRPWTNRIPDVPSSIARGAQPCLDCSASRAVDWISTTFLSWHLHIDLHRTDQLISLLRQFVESASDGPIHEAQTSPAVL